MSLTGFLGDLSVPRCPACDARCDSQPVCTFSATEAAQHFVLAQEHPDQNRRLRQKIASLWKRDDCSIVVCLSCELRFAWPFIAGDGEFYNLAYPYSSYPRSRWEFDKTLTALSTIGARKGKVLEIGSGFGYFLERLSPAFTSPSQVLAIEYNVVAREKLSAAGFAPFDRDVRERDFDIYQGQVDVFFLFQVLEHMDGIKALFDRIKYLARPGADVFIAVPNGRRIAFNERHGSLVDMPPNHISTWSKASFCAMAVRFEMDIVDYQVQDMYLPSVFKQDLVYSHMRRAQSEGSLENRLRSLPRSRIRTLLEAVLASISTPRRFGAWLDAVSSDASLGDSTWVHLRFRSDEAAL
jgi:SAM-dependent methyltransferase